MKGIAVIVNILAALVGGGFGLMFRGKMKARYQQLFLRVAGLGLIGVGAYEFIQHYFVIAGDKLELTGSLLVLMALVFGYILGYLFNIHGALLGLGKKLSKKDDKEKAKETVRIQRLAQAVEIAAERGITPPKVPLLDRIPTYEIPAPLSQNLYADSFLLAVILLCANSMLFNGVMADALNGETTVLFVKSGIDFVICFLLAFIGGNGSLYAVIPMAVLELILWFLCLVAPAFTTGFFTPTMTAQLLVIGSVITIMLGTHMAFEQKKVKAANFLPAFLIPIFYYGIIFLVNLMIGSD